MVTDISIVLEKTTQHLSAQYSALQAGRANASMIEGISVESYGSMMPLKGVANISCPDAKTIRIEPWDKSLVAGTAKAIQEADIGINPQNMGTYILLPIPPMTEERRKKLVKNVQEEAEVARISVRTARQDAMKAVKVQKDAKEISEDEEKRQEKQIQEKVDAANKKIDELAKAKEKDIMTI